jgi:hypothetical protein
MGCPAQRARYRPLQESAQARLRTLGHPEEGEVVNGNDAASPAQWWQREIRGMEDVAFAG